MDATNNPPVLEVRGLTKRFGGLTAVKNLDLEVHAGEIFRPDWPERLRQIDRDEVDHGHRAPDRG